MPLDLSRPAALLGAVRRQVLRRRRPLAARAGRGRRRVRPGRRPRRPAAPTVAGRRRRARPAGRRGARRRRPDDRGVRARHRCPPGWPTQAAGRVLAAPLTRGQPLTEVALVGPAMTGDRDRPARRAGAPARRRRGRAAAGRRRGRPGRHRPAGRRAPRRSPTARVVLALPARRRGDRAGRGCPGGWWCSGVDRRRR